MDKNEDNPPSGFLLIDKPVDWTSHDVVGYLRGALKIKKIGHAGTLDPFATGLLIVGIGRSATKRLDEFKALPKEYVATIKLGATSDTQDRTGTIMKHETCNMKHVTSELIESTLKKFTGKQMQTPPMYSAKKVKGKKLYDLARKGIEIEREPNEIEIFELNLIDYDPKCLVLRVSCLVSTGTYIRTLAHDIGQALAVPRDGVLRGVGAYCEELRRTKIGECSVEDAVGPKSVTKENLKLTITNNPSTLHS